MAHAQYDVVIRGGTVVDGTRMPRFVADIAIKDGLIAEVGSVTGKGEKEIDAEGLIVAPGVIDVHTHYDAQLNWDPYCSQACWHGVTSVIVSACGFGFAPCRPEDREHSMLRMTRVEAIPMETMQEGMRWDWVSQADYLESLENAGLGMNVATYIPQSAIRGYVLGKEDTSREIATPEEIEQMKNLVRDGYRAGALGLSSDLSLLNRDYDGSKLPSAVAALEETEALVSVAREFNVGSIELTPETLHIRAEEAELIERWANLAGRPIYYNAIIYEHHIPDRYKEAMELLDDMNQRVSVYALGLSHRLESMFNLIDYNLFDDMPAWNEALACPMEERIANLKSPEMRVRMQDDLDNFPERIWSGRWDRMMVYRAEEQSLNNRYLSDIAEERGQSPLDVFCDINLKEDLKTDFMIEDMANGEEEVIPEILKHPNVVPGLSDGGAHTQFFCLGKYPTVLLSRWVRDEKIMSLEEAHWRLSYMSAAAIGIEGRGMLLPGWPADIIVYDMDALKVTPDLPVYEPIIGNGKRLIQKAEGYRHVLINGVETFRDGECTNELPGQVIRTRAYEKGAKQEGL